MKFLVVALASMAVLASASCPNMCSSHGRCGSDDICTCFPGFTGSDCSQRLCKRGLAWVDANNVLPHAWAECSNKGICDRTTGECSCYEGYEGAGCVRSICPNGCSGHGTCEFIEDLGRYNSSNWDWNRIQGCKCDGGYEGTDCSQRRCPRGDDPLTIPTATTGQVWTFTVVDDGAPTSADFYLEVDDLYGNTYRSRPWEQVSVLASGLTDTLWSEIVNDIIAINEVSSATVSNVGTDTTYTFTLVDPKRVSDIRIYTSNNADGSVGPAYCPDAGCYPLMNANAPTTAIVSATADHVDADPMVETDECSNRGICERSTGICQCFEGHYGLACQLQTILV